ncbi:RAD3-like DNA-binding helicase protein isoform X2 [Wolffia australiana]
MPIYRIRGIDVDFPFEAYDCQIVYMDKVIQSLQEGCNALLESPTGTGKTLCLLCAALAWRKSLGPFSSEFQKEKLSQSSDDAASSQRRSSYPSIVYASRTHSQLKQVIGELKTSNYRPKMGILGSREQMCIHDQVKTQQGKTQNNACYYLRKKRSCRHHSLVSDYMKSHPEIGNEPLDIEDLVDIGRTLGPCPYYMSRDLHKTVDILFCPYNYLIDPARRDSLSGIQWDNAVLIFDEAHNLESVCADAASFDLPLRFLSACISEADQCVSLAAKRRSIQKSAENEHDPENYAILKALLLKLEKRISEVVIDSKESGFTRPGLYIYEFLAELNITSETANMLTGTIESCVQLLEERHMNGYLNGMKGTICRLELIKDILKNIFRDGGKSHANFYRFHVHESHQNASDSLKGKTTSRVLSWWCFHPGIAMREFLGLSVRSIIMTSGTLSPLDSFAGEMGIEFPVRLENPHVVSQNQVWVGVISRGPSGFSFNSSYRNRDSIDYKQDLGNAIVNFTRIVPDGLLVFFPSYYFMDRCIECWKNMSHSGSSGLNTIWERMCKNKQPVVEPKDSQLFGSSIDDFQAKLRDKSTSGAVFFAVCRGKVSEGLDFADHAGRAVVITGMPFSMMTDPKVRLKRDFLDQQASSQKNALKPLTGEEWYVQQATRAVNQAIGRVIRHRHDYGAIIFCDERFAQRSHQEKMSLWLRPHVKTYSKFGDVVFTLTGFFRDQASREKVKELQKDDPVRGLSKCPSGKDEADQDEIKILPPPRPVINIPGKRGPISVDSIDQVIPANKSTVSALNNPFILSNSKRKMEGHVANSAQGHVASANKAAKTETGATEQTKGSVFLVQVKEKLSEEEYKEFVGLMKALKMKKMGIVSVLDSIARLFSLPGRYSLLQSFRDYVPSQYKLLYEKKHLSGDQSTNI